MKNNNYSRILSIIQKSQNPDLLFSESHLLSQYNFKDLRKVIDEILQLNHINSEFRIMERYQTSNNTFVLNIRTRRQNLKFKFFQKLGTEISPIFPSQEKYSLIALNLQEKFKIPKYFGTYVANRESLVIVSEWLNIESTFHDLICKLPINPENKNIISKFKDFGVTIGNYHNYITIPDHDNTNYRWPFDILTRRFNKLQKSKHISKTELNEIINLLLEKLNGEIPKNDYLILSTGDVNPNNWGFLYDGDIVTFDFNRAKMDAPERDLARIHTFFVDAQFAGLSISKAQEIVDAIFEGYYRTFKLKINEQRLLLWRFYVHISSASFWVNRDLKRLKKWLNQGLSLIDYTMPK